MQSIGVKCECCSKSDHLLHLCPLIHFVPQKFQIIRKGIPKERHKSQDNLEFLSKRLRIGFMILYFNKLKLKERLINIKCTVLSAI